MSNEHADARGPDTAPSLWALVPLADYQLPPTPAASAARARWTSLRRLFGQHNDDAQAPARAEADLRGLPGQRLDALAGPLDWLPAADALQQTLAEDGAAEAVRFVVGPPRGGHADLLRCWAAGQGAHGIDPPVQNDILTLGASWLDRWPSDVRCWVLPRLEHWWLRHAAGLALVRELLEQALTGRLGRGVIGCDSWAWAYLRHVAAVPTRSALTLQAFDGERLARLFRSLVVGDAVRPVCFRNAQTGRLVLAVDGGDEAPGGSELQYLAARCRGNAGLARALWRARLYAEPDTDDDGARQESAPSGDGCDGTAIWVAEPHEDPSLPADRDEEVALVLHALLLHNGLVLSLLIELLPLPPFRVQTLVRRLAAGRAIAADPAGRWRVTAAGYAAVRELLRAQGFLLDDF